MKAGELVKNYWPIVVTLGGGLIALGTLRADVGQLRASHAEVKVEVDKQRLRDAADHDLLIQLNSQQGQTTAAVNEIRDDLKELTRYLRRPSVWDRMTGRDRPTGQDPSDQR